MKTITDNKVCPMCKHQKLTYLGKQPLDPKGRKVLYLFNCSACHSTVTLESIKRRKA